MPVCPRREKTFHYADVLMGASVFSDLSFVCY